MLQLERIVYFLINFYYDSNQEENFNVVLSGRFNKCRSPSHILDSLMKSDLSRIFPLLFHLYEKKRFFLHEQHLS